jgi:predicted PurR-regulated permease PerM
MRQRLRLSTRSLVVVVLVIAVALVARNVIGRSSRVLGWLVAASIVAALVQPVVAFFQRQMRRSLAVLCAVGLLVASVGSVAYATLDDLRDQGERLQRVLPQAAARIERRDDRFGEAARDFQLSERISDLVDDLPDQIAGGSGTDALRSAAGRTGAFLAGGVLTIFLLIYGERLLGGLSSLLSSERRARIEPLARTAYARWWRYCHWSIAISIAAGAAVWALARALEIPGPVVLGLAVGVFSTAPYIGVVIGALPLLLVAGGTQAGWRVALVGATVVVLQAAEILVRRRVVERRSLRLGPAVPVVVGMLAFDFAGIGGALVGIALAVGAAAVASSLGDEVRDAEIETGRHAEDGSGATDAA